MRSSPVTAWQELSALYEQADEFGGAELEAWLATPRIAGHAQVAALRRMLAAREQLRNSDFLNAPPRLEPSARPPGVETQALRVGTPIGPYRLLCPLGSGGMAEVWLAERSDGAFQRRVAIKLMFRQVGGAARDSVAQRFERERDILASLDHPNIAALHDAGVTPAGQPWLALEYVEGRPLSDWCDHARLGVAERVRLFRQVLMAVQHAHAKLVMHRDLKPANILVADSGEVHLLDFGIAKLFEPGEGAQADTELTRAAGRLLTPLYASPEQLRGEPLTIACDVYALGVVLYELLSGERPYEVKAESAARLEQAILETDPRAPSRRVLREEAVERRGLTAKALRKALAGDLDAIILQALAKQPAQRYASADAMLAELDRWLDGEPVKAHAPSAVYRWGKFVRRNRLGVGLGTGAMLALAGVATVAVIQGQQAQRESARAVAARDFMIDMFRRADTAKVRGADVTAREMLEIGRRDVSQRLAHQPELQTELLQAIGSIQHDMGEYVHAAGTLDEAAQALENRHAHRAAAMARATHAESVFQLGDYRRALALVAKARVSFERGGHDDAIAAKLNLTEAWTRMQLGETAAAQSLFDRGLAEITRTFGPDHMNTIEALQGLSLLAAERGDFISALALQDDIALRVERSASLSARDVANIDYERVIMLQRAGWYRRAYDDAGKAAVSCAATVGPRDEACQLLTVQKVHAALRLGRVEQVRADASVLEALAAEGQSPRRQAHALQLLCRLHAALNSAPIAKDREARLAAIGQSADEVALSPELKFNALLALADAAVRAAQPAIAQRWARLALEGPLAEKVSSAGIAWAQTLMGVALSRQGQHAVALEWLRKAHVRYGAQLGELHPMTQVFAINQAIALAALGRRDEAIAIVERATPVLRDAMGDDAPTYRLVLEVLRRLGEKYEGMRGDMPAPATPSPFFI